MSELKTNLDEILQEKQNKIIPANIKKNVQIFDVIGTYTGNSGTDYEVKLFETEEEMQADENAQEGDLAVIYRSEIRNMTVDTQTQYITFPETVVLPEAFTSDVYCMLRAIDTSVMFDGNIQLSKTSFRFDCYSESGMIRVQYSSSDGITYTRNRFSDDSGDLTNPVDFGTTIQVYMPEEWNDNLGYFMQIGGNVFEGLYRANNIINGYKYPLLNLNSISVTDYIEIPEEILNLNAYAIIPTQITDYKLVSGRIYMGISNFYKFTDYDWVMSTFTDTVSYYDYTSNVLSEKQTDTLNMQICGNGSNTNKYYSVTPDGYTTVSEIIILRSLASCGYDYATDTSGCPFVPGKEYGSSGIKPTFYVNDYPAQPVYKVEYQLAPTQLTATKDLVYNSTYYSKDGVNEGVLTQNVSNSFADINAEVYNKIQKAYDNMEPRVLTDNDKTIDKNIYFILTNTDGNVLLDTSQVTSMENMFNGCKNLCEIPLIDTSNVTSFRYAFANCSNLTKIALLDTSKVTTMDSAFVSCKSLEEIPLFNTSSVTNMTNTFFGCSAIKQVPLLDISNVTIMNSTFSRCTSLTELPQLNTGKVTDMNYMCSGCTNLVTVPVLNTSSVDTMGVAFENCPNLSDESLNNIMQMCINAVSYTRTKTLAYIGLTEEQAQTCATLSNYEAFTAAGWTTGY